MRKVLEYTCEDDRSGVWEGTFLETDEINVGDYILVHHKCKHCMKPLLKKVIGKKLAYTFVDEINDKNIEVYDFLVKGGSSYKSNLKLISINDSRIADCECKL